MGHNDHFEIIRPTLPKEAGAYTKRGFEPNLEWLKSADPEQVREALQTWFETRYWDPANDTPYNGREGGYLYIHGGPYDASEELFANFGDDFPGELIQAVIDEVESDGIMEWAPIHTEPDYDEDFALEPSSRSDPYRFFRERLSEVDALAASEIQVTTQPLLRQLLFSYLIAALEAYLADTLSYWISAEKGVFRKFVGVCEEFKQRKLTLSEILERVEQLDDDIEQYLQRLVWHRLDKVIPLMSQSLETQMPDIGPLMAHVVVRHDIVHRGGKTKEGAKIFVDDSDLKALRSDVVTFVDKIEKELRNRFPEEVAVAAEIDDEF